MVCREAVHLSFEGPTAAADNDSIVFPDARKKERRREKKERTRRRTRRRRRRRWRRRRRRWKRVFFCFSLDLVPSLPLSLRRRSPPPQPSFLTLAQKKTRSPNRNGISSPSTDCFGAVILMELYEEKKSPCSYNEEREKEKQ